MNEVALEQTENTKEKNIKTKKKRKPRNRIWELDFLRGVSIVLMCIDHLFVDVVNMYPEWRLSSKPFFSGFYHAAARYIGVSSISDRFIMPEWTMQLCEYVFLLIIMVAVTLSFTLSAIKQKPDKDQLKNYIIGMGIASVGLVVMAITNNTLGYELDGITARDFVHPVILWFFFLLCGLSCRFSKNNFKRTIQITVCAGLISLFTYLAELVFKTKGLLVTYGVLHMLATAVLIYSLIELLCKLIFKDEEKRKYAISAVCLAVAIVGYVINQYIWTIQESITSTDWLGWFHYAFGDEFGSFSSDWFTISESLYKVMFGAAIAPFIYPTKKSLFPKLDIVNKGFFTFMGRHTLIVVLAHQVIISGLLLLINFAA